MYKVSIIIPIYNVEQYLSECINSVLNQTYKNIEIILVNDGSPDNSDIICKNFAKKYSNIKYIFQENQGVSVARNNGLQYATGDFIYFLDADDTINNVFIESCVNTAKLNESDIVYIETETGRKGIENKDLYALTIWEILIRKSFLDNYPNIRFPVGIKNFEDTIFSHMLICLTNNIDKNITAKHFYRKRDGQVSSLISKNKSLTVELLPKWLDILEKFYDKYKLWDSCKTYISLLIEEISLNYWNVSDLSNNNKEFFFNTIHYFINKHSLEYEKIYLSSIHNFMLKKFFKSNNWQSFEKYRNLMIVLKKIKNFVKFLRSRNGE